MFPRLSEVSAVQASENYFVRACAICANNGSNPLNGSPGRLQLALYLLTAHIAQLNANSADGQPPSGLVGRIGSATQGSVTVQVEWDGTGAPGEAWFIQTQYGAEFWQMSASTRTAWYIPSPTRVLPGFGPYGYGRGFGRACSWN